MAEILDGILSVLQVILVFGLTISFLVFIHEGGHFLAAKWAGVWVHEFAIGMGPAAWRRKKGETEYTFRILPIGGYVRMAGEDGLADDDTEIPKDRLFSEKSGWARTGIIFAGPFVNVVAALILMIVYVGVVGMSFVEVGEVMPDAPAQGVLRSGDKIVSIDGEPIYSESQMQAAVQSSEGEPLFITIRRGDETIQTQIESYFDEEQGRYLVGITFAYPLSRVGQLPDAAPLAQQGLQSGDDILTVNGQAVASWPDVVSALQAAVEQGVDTVSVSARRGNETLQVNVRPDELDFSALRNRGAAVQVRASWSVLSRVENGSVWAESGLQAGDRILSANGLPIHSAIELIKAIELAQSRDDTLQIVVDRNGLEQTMAVDLSGHSLEQAFGGLQFEQALRQPGSLGASIQIGSQQLWNFLSLTYFGLKQVITGQMDAQQALAGPVGIAHILGQSIDQGFQTFFQIVVLLSLILGVFNLLPFPALDGGRIVIIGINGLLKLVVGKPIPPEKEGWIHYVGFMLLIALILFITVGDVQRILPGGM